MSSIVKGATRSTLGAMARQGKGPALLEHTLLVLKAERRELSVDCIYYLSMLV